MAYLLTKTVHLVFVIAWMATVFYLPRILVNIAEAGREPAVRARLVLMGRRLYNFGHVMFGIALVFGLVLWLHFGIGGHWLHAKLLLVLMPSGKALRWFNELPVLLLFAVVYLVLAKPF
jgi:putative membrane protein